MNHVNGKDVFELLAQAFSISCVLSILVGLHLYLKS